MTIHDELTVFPPADALNLADLQALMGEVQPAQAKMVGPTGEEYVLPPEVFDVLRRVVSAMAEGAAVTVAPVQLKLTTQEAADLLGVRRMALIGLLDAGDIPFEQAGRHRRIRLIDVLDYRERRSGQRRAALDEIVAISDDSAMYELTATPHPTR